MLCSKCSAEIRPVVALDIDGTLGDYHGHFTKFASEYTARTPGRQYRGAEGFKIWAMEQFGIDERTWHDIKLAYRQGGMKRSMPAFFGASWLCDVIRGLGAELWMTTTRPYLRLDGIDPDTRFWLDLHGMKYDGLLYDEAKYERLAERVAASRVVAVIDDLPEMIEAAGSRFGPSAPIWRRQVYNVNSFKPMIGGGYQVWENDDLREISIEVKRRIEGWKP